MDVRFTGIDPFPEAVRPAEYLYYSADATASGRGILVPLTGIAIFNSGSQAGDAFFPAAELDRLLQEAALRDPAE